MDPFGKQMPFSPEDFDWELPEGFPEIKYSCFNGALCILEWKPTREQEAIHMCLKLEPRPCITTCPMIIAGHTNTWPWAGSHTCAITKDDEIRCWGDNFLGQLGAATTTKCVFNGCSLVPVPVVCPGGRSVQVPFAGGGWRSHLRGGHE